MNIATFSRSSDDYCLHFRLYQSQSRSFSLG